VPVAFVADVNRPVMERVDWKFLKLNWLSIICPGPAKVNSIVKLLHRPPDPCTVNLNVRHWLPLEITSKDTGLLRFVWPAQLPSVGPFTGVGVGVRVGVLVATLVAVGVGVGVLVATLVAVGVAVDSLVGVAVGLVFGVAVQVPDLDTKQGDPVSMVKVPLAVVREVN
jgi:hypothetical protein